MKQNRSYEEAKEQYMQIGVDTDLAIARLLKIRISMQCWQGDDVRGFLSADTPLSGGIQVTGNYPGAARCAEELRMDLREALSLIPGKHKVKLLSLIHI